MNISGIVVLVRPESADLLKQQLASMAGVAVHAVKENGCIVITVEDVPESAPAESLMRVQNLPGVLSASMVYNYCDEQQKGESYEAEQA